MSNKITKYNTKYDNPYEDLEKRVLNLPTASNRAMAETVEGMYASKPLFGASG